MLRAHDLDCRMLLAKAAGPLRTISRQVFGYCHDVAEYLTDVFCIGITYMHIHI